MYIHQVSHRTSQQKQLIRVLKSYLPKHSLLITIKTSPYSFRKAKDGGAELVFLPIYYTEASLILAQADSMGFETKFFGCDGMDGILGVENFDTSLAEGLMLLTPFAADSTDEKTQNFVKAYKDAYKDTPNQFAADAYDAVYAVKAAAEKEDVKADMDVADICAALEKGMTEITLEGVTGDEITWTEDGDAEQSS